MVAGDTKRIVVIKNISSNLIEEAIFILKSDTGAEKGNCPGGKAANKINAKNDFILKEAENIINQYIKENGLIKVKGRRYQTGKRMPYINLSVNSIINIFLIAAMVFLAAVIGKVLW